jgi:hypothetical protein
VFGSLEVDGVIAQREKGWVKASQRGGTSR